MSELQPNNSSYNVQTGTPLYEYGQNQTNQVQPQQTVNVTSPYTSQIYQYPQTSVYNDPSKQAASGVNIYIYNPSAMGGQNTSAVPQVVTYPQPQTAVQSEAASQPIANTPISEDNKKEEVDPSTQKTKRVVELTDDYIKTLESYLRNSDKSIRESGIIELVKRFEEDITRYDDEALTALLNIALQDSNPDNRVLAMMAITSGSAHGNEETIELLNKLQSSDKLYGREAQIATEALLKASTDNTKIVRDFSSNNKNSDS
ncbi:MAG: hypothetical protein LUH05_02400 [Candidatus Gastranaerophilales bacterium]|nr:hypothetical protein [Candidatus Gastranaerophilales bacterium]